MLRLMILLCSLSPYSLAQATLGLDIELTVNSNSITKCEKNFSRHIILVENSTSGNTTRWITMRYNMVLPVINIPYNCGNTTITEVEGRIRLSLALSTMPEECCTKEFPSRCKAEDNLSRMFCDNNIIRTNIQECGPRIRGAIRNRTRTRTDCSLNRSQLSPAMRRYCLLQLKDEDDDEEEDISAHFRTLSNFRRSLCVGNLARSIRKGLRLSRRNRRRMNITDYEVVLNTLDFVFEPSFSTNWKNRTLSDTTEIVDTTEEVLNELVIDRRDLTDDFFFGAQNLAYNVIKLQSSCLRRFSFPSSDKKKNFTILREASVDFSIDENKGTDCNATIGVSVINADYVEYVQDTIRGLNESDTRIPVSAMLSLVVLNADGSHSSCVNFQHAPIQLTFTPQIEIFYNYSYEGYFLKITNDTLDWDTTGLTTRMSSDGLILVETTHLTSFAVLVSPTNNVEPSLSEAQKKALNAVSYIGCVISIVSLILTIICLLMFRKKLKKGVLLYVHLNLAISLLLALLVFVFGVDLASHNMVLCKTVAAVIQYFFLCAFLWMLGEGVMLYILLVKVFGNLADKWYLLIPICWGIPILIVSISAGLLSDNYITTNENRTYCWIKASPSEPAIWTFVGPVILFTSINTVILLLTVGSIIKTRIFVSGITEKNNSKLEIVKIAVKGSIILLPLLGLTWLLGIFAVNSNTVVFAWLFTIVNSLQGCFIFLIHVLRNEYVWGKVKRALCIKQIKERLTSSQFFTASTSNGTALSMNGEMNHSTGGPVSELETITMKGDHPLPKSDDNKELTK